MSDERRISRRELRRLRQSQKFEEQMQQMPSAPRIPSHEGNSTNNSSSPILFDTSRGKDPSLFSLPFTYPVSHTDNDDEEDFFSSGASSPDSASSQYYDVQSHHAPPPPSESEPAVFTRSGNGNDISTQVFQQQVEAPGDVARAASTFSPTSNTHTPYTPLENQNYTMAEPSTSPSQLGDSREPVYPVAPRTRRRGFDFISWIGEILVTVGVILGLFAFWQVFVTDWQVANDSRLALADFYRGVTCPTNISHDKRTTDPPTITQPSDGSAFGAIHVPEWDYMVLPLRQGTNQKVLDTASAGHYIETALPGQIGNFSVAAHRRSYGSSFRYINTLKDGDPVVVETKNAWIIYRVYTHEIVLPDKTSVIFPVPNQPNATPKDRLMTMTTCHPEYGNSQRYIVHLKFDYWTPHNAGLPPELAGGGKHKCM